MRHVRTGVALGSAAAVSLLLAGCAGDDAEEETTEESAERWAFTSRPDLDPPVIEVTGEVAGTGESSYVLIGPKRAPDEGEEIWQGGLIVDDAGEPVWVRTDQGAVWDLRVQEYEGEPVLTWWEGEFTTPLSEGEVVILDDTYTEVTRVTVGGDLEPGTADLHETTITEDGTMLLMAYVPAEADLSEIGGPADGWVWEGVVQEVDIATGEVLFQWRSLDHVPVTDAMEEIEEDEGTEDTPFDYFHVNAMSIDDDGSYLVSARNTHAVYSLDPDSGEVNWVLGGSASDFEMGEGATFAWQHDAHRRPDGTLTIFDNQASPQIEESRGIRLELDEQAMTATLVTEYLAPDDRVSANQGNMQELDNGDVVIGWGNQPYYSQFSHDGELLYDATFHQGSNYRAYRHTWSATPAAPPTAVLESEDDTTTVYASWNGATEVASWRVLTGESGTQVTEAATAERDGFETAIEVPDAGPYVAVEALDENGEVLGTAVAGE